MGILKVLGTIVTTIAWSPIPECIAAVGAVANVATVVLSCSVNSSTTDVVWEADGDFHVEETPKTTPVDIMYHLMPGEDFSIRKAYGKYLELDVDGKDAVKAMVISTACAGFYVFNSLVRVAVANRCWMNWQNAAERNAYLEVHTTVLIGRLDRLRDELVSSCDGSLDDQSRFRAYADYSCIMNDLIDILKGEA